MGLSALKRKRKFSFITPKSILMALRSEKVEFFLDNGDMGLLARDVSLLEKDEDSDYF